jgi:replicative DNA helicase
VPSRRAAAVAALGAAWPAKGRHHAQLALAGALRSINFSEQDAVEFLSDVCRIAGDENRPKRIATCRRTYSLDVYTGWTRLSELMDRQVVTAARDLLTKGPFEDRVASLAQRVAQDRLNRHEHALVFPVDALPLVLARFVEAQAQFTSTPTALPGVFALGACTAAIGGKVDIEIIPGLDQPLTLYLVLGAKTGERKSPVHDACFRPLRQAERYLVERDSLPAAQVEARRSTLQKRLLKIQSKRAEVQPGTLAVNGARSSHDLDKEIAELVTEIEKLKAKPPTRFFVDDVTLEKLGSLLGEYGRICVSSDEGTILSNVAGRYAKDGRSSFGLLLQAYSGTEIRIDRKSDDEPVYVRNPRLTICIAVQPSVIEGLAQDRTMREQGLLARFLYSLPDSLVGSRETRLDATIPIAVQDAYAKRLTEMALFPAPEGDIPKIRLSPEARALWVELSNATEKRLHPKTGDLIDMVEWANKYPSTVARISGIFHCIDHGPMGDVSADTFARATRLGEYFLAHARLAFGSMGKGVVEQDAEVLLTWAERKASRFTLREARQYAPRPLRGDKKRLAEAIDLLYTSGHLNLDGEGWRIGES